METYESYKDDPRPRVVRLPKGGAGKKWDDLGSNTGPTTVTSDKKYPEKFRVDTLPGASA